MNGDLIMFLLVRLSLLVQLSFRAALHALSECSGDLNFDQQGAFTVNGDGYVWTLSRGIFQRNRLLCVPEDMLGELHAPSKGLCRALGSGFAQYYLDNEAPSLAWPLSFQ